MADIYDYSDFRRFLRDTYELEKTRDAKFSLRYYTQKLGLKSSGFFSDVLSGKKNLTGTYALKCAKLLKLDREREEYFLNLVYFNQAKSLDEKNRYYEKMMACTKVKIDPIEAHQFDYFANWHHAAIRELLHFYPFQNDYAALGKQLNPAIKSSEAKRSVELLMRLGLIAQDGKGFWRPTANTISTGSRFNALNVMNWHHNTLDLAQRALNHYPAEERGFSALTLPLTPDKVRKARQAIKNLRLYLMALSENGEKADRVIQFNFQFFPLSTAERQDGATL